MWTLICFCLFILIVNKLLFKPMLAIIDERRAKIEAAARKKADIEASQREYEENLKLAAENARKNEHERAEKMLSEARQHADDAIKEAEQMSKSRLELAAGDIAFENEELGNILSESVDKLAGTFISRLIS